MLLLNKRSNAIFVLLESKSYCYLSDKNKKKKYSFFLIIT